MVQHATLSVVLVSLESALTEVHAHPVLLKVMTAMDLDSGSNYTTPGNIFFPSSNPNLRQSKKDKEVLSVLVN